MGLNINTICNIVSCKEVVFQEIDCLIEVAHGTGDRKSENLSRVIMHAQNIGIVKRKEMMQSSFSEIAEWSTDSDVLILIDNKLLICIPESYLSKNNEL